MLTLALTTACILIPSFFYWKALRSVRFMPGYRPMFEPTSLLGATFRESWWNLGLDWAWKYRKTAYFNYHHDIISIVPWLAGEASYVTCSLDVAKQLLANERQTELLKPTRFSLPFLLWGDNVFTTNGDMWKRHRRIMGPAFNAKMYSTVVEQTIAIYREMVDMEGWKDQAEVVVKNFRRLPVRLAFLTIARCGFGMSLNYAEDANVDQNQKIANDMTVEQGFGVISETIIQRLAFPKWIYRLPIKRIRKIDQAWNLLASFMHKSIGLRGEQLVNDPNLLDERPDVFTRLVAAADEKAKYHLDKSEVIGNTFILMFAGHETTALVLTLTIAYLAFHQDEQEKAYQEITSVIPSDRDPNLDDLSKLIHTLACFNESLRLQPPAPILTRTLPEDIPIKVQRPQEATVVLKEGTLFLLDVISIHRNPNVFPSPDKFQPSRWYNVPEHEISMFGIGPRSCIGRKFGIVESLAFLAMLLREWKVDIVLKEGESREDWEQRVIEKGGHVGMTFGITVGVDLKLRKR